MFSFLVTGFHLIESSDKRVRISRELAVKSKTNVTRSHDLVLQSRALLAQNPPFMLECAQPSLHQSTVEDSRPQNLTPTENPREPSGDLLQRVSGRTIENQIVDMDGKHFLDCEILNCTLQYSGLPVLIESSRFSGCNFQFAGQASLTLRFLECFELMPEGKINYAYPAHPSKTERPN